MASSSTSLALNRSRRLASNVSWSSANGIPSVLARAIERSGSAPSRRLFCLCRASSAATSKPHAPPVDPRIAKFVRTLTIPPAPPPMIPASHMLEPISAKASSSYKALAIAICPNSAVDSCTASVAAPVTNDFANFNAPLSAKPAPIIPATFLDAAPAPGIMESGSISPIPSNADGANPANSLSADTS